MSTSAASILKNRTPGSVPDPVSWEMSSEEPRSGHFEAFAQQIYDRIRPQTVLEIGCGAGGLVAALRSRDIDAEGLESNPSALEGAADAVRPHLRTGDPAEPFPHPYDLIILLNPDGSVSDAVLDNLTRHTGDLLFAAPPPEFAGSAKALPLERWVARFARRGFFRDADFDAGFIAPWAVRFRRSADLSPADLVEAYEARLWALQSENIRLRDKVREKDAALGQIDIENHPLMQTLTYRLAQWESMWADLERSAGWKFVHQVRRLRLKLAPPGSRRAAFLRLIRDSLTTLRTQGLPAFLQHWWAGLRSPELRFAVGQKTVAQLNTELYPDFVARNTLSNETLSRQRVESAAWEWRPLISFLTPIYNPPAPVLRALLDSVQAQTYDRWELCIADASLREPQTRAVLAEYAAADDRIRVRLLPNNLGICGNSNAALAMATGEFVAILDHDDVIAPEMLFEVVQRIRQNPAADVVYFDEDKLTEDGRERIEPFFKPDFSPELLLSANYLMHGVFRRSLVEAVGGFDPAFEGCQDWDLALKVTERSRKVEHIPRVLYHWRQTRGSTSGDFGAKAYVFERQLACVRNHLVRTGLAEAETTFPDPGYIRATWPVSGRKVSIIIPTKDKVKFLRRTIESLRSQTRYTDYEILVVDNASRKRATHKYFDRLRTYENVRIIDYQEPFNYSRANNLGAAEANGEIFLFLNNDVKILHADWLEEMVRWADRPDIGVVGARLLYPDNLVQHAGVVVGMEGHASHVFHGYRKGEFGPFGSADWYRNFTAVTGACMMVRRDVFEAIGGFSEKYILAFSDIEICIRAIRNGYRVMYTPHARLHHFEGKSRGDHIPTIDIRAGIEDFLPIVEAGDPYYNPNLSYVERKPMVLPPQEEDRVSRLLRVAAGARIDELTRPLGSGGEAD